MPTPKELLMRAYSQASEGERLVGEQRVRVSLLHREGFDTGETEQLLVKLETSLATLRDRLARQVSKLGK